MFEGIFTNKFNKNECMLNLKYRNIMQSLTGETGRLESAKQHRIDDERQQ